MTPAEDLQITPQVNDDELSDDALEEVAGGVAEPHKKKKKPHDPKGEHHKKPHDPKGAHHGHKKHHDPKDHLPGLPGSPV